MSETMNGGVDFLSEAELELLEKFLAAASRTITWNDMGMGTWMENDLSQNLENKAFLKACVHLMKKFGSFYESAPRAFEEIISGEEVEQLPALASKLKKQTSGPSSGGGRLRTIVKSILPTILGMGGGKDKKIPAGEAGSSA